MRNGSDPPSPYSSCTFPTSAMGKNTNIYRRELGGFILRCCTHGKVLQIMGKGKGIIQPENPNKNCFRTVQESQGKWEMLLFKWFINTQ